MGVTVSHLHPTVADAVMMITEESHYVSGGSMSILCSCIDNAVKLKSRNGESYWIDTLTIHGKDHEVIIKNYDREFNGFIHSPECWCLNKEVNKNE